MKKYENFVRALANLASSNRIKPPYSPVEQAGIVKLFEICYEQAWKMMKEIMEYHGLNPDKTGSPRLITKLAYQNHLINDQEAWLNILDNRNLTTHIYDDEESLAAIKKIQKIYVPLFIELRSEIEKSWLNVKE